MDIQTEKSVLIKRLEQINDLSLIQAIKHMVDYGLREKNNGTSIEQYNKEIDEIRVEMKSRATESLKDIKKGEVISIEEFRKENKQWLKGKYIR